MKAVVILIDTRERECSHIIKALDGMGVRHEARKLDLGDYSFCVGGRDFSTSCTIEPKNGPDELYGNITEKVRGDWDNRLEKELAAGGQALKQFTLLIEGIASMQALRNFVVPDWKMKASPQRVCADIGKTCYAALKGWQASNRYGFRVEFAADKADTAIRIVEEFYYFYRNYKTLITSRRCYGRKS